MPVTGLAIPQLQIFTRKDPFMTDIISTPSFFPVKKLPFKYPLEMV